MTFFEVEQIEEFVHSLERHLDGWLFDQKEMRMLLTELNQIDKKLQKACSVSGYPADQPAFSELVDDLQHRTASCRINIQERLMG